MKKVLIWVSLFALAFGFLEAAVVVYLRELYYPEGFVFPLKEIPLRIFLVELVRELSTLIILLSVGIIAGKNLALKIAYFLYSFAFWDIFYYFFLKLTLNWPESFLTWDLLFLIPVPWSAPVIAPVIVSLTMILFSLAIVYFAERKMPIRLKKLDWVALGLAVILVFLSFIWNFPQLVKGGIPQKFPWTVFFLAELLSLVIFYRLFL